MPGPIVPKSPDHVGFRLGLVITITMLLVGPTYAATITVCNGSCEHTSIQMAIDTARPGDTIEVHSGTYHESVNVTKPLTLLGMDTGSGTPIVDAGGRENAILLKSDRINLKGFEVRGAIGSGINVASNNSTVHGNTARQNFYGILLHGSGNIITGNRVFL